MKTVRGYSEFLASLNDGLRKGIIADTNVLIAATYDPDPAHEAATGFLDLLAENQVPIFCNVNVKSEFLEIHRRIIFTEALLDFESQVSKLHLDAALRKKLNSLRTRAEKRTSQGSLPIRLAEAEIKDFKLTMSQISNGTRDSLWSALCEGKVGDKLLKVWKDAEEELGINFLSTRREDKSDYFMKEPGWDDAMGIMGKYGVSSSDAMIMNMFAASKLVAMVTSDLDVALSLSRMAVPEKFVFLPDGLARTFG